MDGFYSSPNLPVGSYKVGFFGCGDSRLETEYHSDKSSLAAANLVSVTAGATRTIDATLALKPPPDSEVLDPVATAQQVQKQKGKRIKVKLAAGADEPVEIDASGKVKLGKKKLALGPSATSSGAGQQAQLVLKPTKKGAKKISKALKKGSKLRASLVVRFEDAALNSATRNLTVKLVG